MSRAMNASMHRIARIVLAGLLFVSARSANAQLRASELASVSQTVDGTKITVEYSRPRARGRTTLFGTRIVQWNEVWTPGANFATTLAVNKDVRIAGTTVPKGQYSVWMVVRQTGNWTLVLDPRARLYHMEHPDSTAQQIRVPIPVEQVTPAMDVLTWAFPAVRSTGTLLTMQWGSFRASIDIAVQPSLTYTLAESDARPYLGRYTGKQADGTEPKTPWDLVVLYEGGMLKAEFDPKDSYMNRFVLIRVGPDIFTAGLYEMGEIVDGGQIYEVLRPDMMFTFKRRDGKIVGFEIRDADDKAESQGVKKAGN